MRNSYLSSKELDNITRQTACILQWIPMHLYGDYDPPFLETLIKSLILLSENTSLHEDNIVSSLLDSETNPGNSMLVKFYKQNRTIFRNLNTSLKMFSNKIIRNSKTTRVNKLVRNAVILDNILQQVRNVYGNDLVVYPSLVNGLETNNVNQRRQLQVASRTQKFYLMINRLFRLPASEINIAIERIMKNVDFNILAIAFCSLDDNHTQILPKCIIFVERMCELVDRADVPVVRGFLRSIIHSSEQNGLQLIQKCLQNRQFVEIMSRIFHRFLRPQGYDYLEANNAFKADLFYTLHLMLQIKPLKGPFFSKVLTQIFAVFQ